MPEDANKLRLDQALVTRGLVATRARARDLILRGEVHVDGTVATKPAQRIAAASALSLKEGAGAYVSRGALKLRAALTAFGLESAGRIGLDLGASTGGFTEVLLAGGASRVYAIDNGRGQLDPGLGADPRVVSLEETDARSLDATLVPHPAGCIVADVSFTSLTKVLPPALALAAPGCWLVALIKPQFEADRANVPRHGVITDPNVHAEACRHVEHWLAGCTGWRILGLIPSPIKGGDGNVEFLIGAMRDAG